jgi:hypothetical protein
VPEGKARRAIDSQFYRNGRNGAAAARSQRAGQAVKRSRRFGGAFQSTGGRKDGDAVLKAAGGAFDDVMDVIVFIVDPEKNFEKAWKIVPEYWGGDASHSALQSTEPKPTRDKICRFTGRPLRHKHACCAEVLIPSSVF